MIAMNEIADPERRLALAYASSGCRAALSFLWALDERLGSLVAATTEPILGAIRLTWWREALGKLGTGEPADEPLLQQLEQPARDGLDRKRLMLMVDGWQVLLTADSLTDAAILRHGADRGSALFALSAQIAGGEHDGLADAGAGWALTDLAYHIRDSALAEQARRRAAEALARVDGRWPRALRPLAMLVALARRDCSAVRPGGRRQGSPVRLGRAMWAGLTGY